MSILTSTAGKSLRTIIRRGGSSSSISAPLASGRANTFARRPFSSSVRNEMPLHITGRVEGLEHECVTGRPPKWTFVDGVYAFLTLGLFGYVWATEKEEGEEGEEGEDEKKGEKE